MVQCQNYLLVIFDVIFVQYCSKTALKSFDRCYVHGAVYRFGRFSMYTATCIRLSSVAYVHNIMFAFHTDYLCTREINFCCFICVTQRWDLRVMKRQLLHLTFICRLCKAASHGWCKLVASG